jgi:hypothetical protein
VTVIAAAIEAASADLWSDPARHNYWPHRTGAARRRIVETALGALAAAGHAVPPEEIGDALADAYNALHDEELSLFPEAHETLVDRWRLHPYRFFWQGRSRALGWRPAAPDRSAIRPPASTNPRLP